MRKQVSEHFLAQGYPVSKVLRILDLPSSSYYYIPKANAKPKGRATSTHTKTSNGSLVKNEIVVNQIEKLLSKEFVDYGYRKVTHWLRKHKHYIINEKKVYRLMKESGLLNDKNRYKRKSKRHWVSDLVPVTQLSFQYLEFDIKYIWIEGQNRYALLLSVIDVHSRWLLGQSLLWKIKKEQVIELFDRIFDTYDLPIKIYVRNDNGSQFEANMVQQYFADKNVIQEFCKPATPEQNAHIESYHSILESVICRKYSFLNLVEAQQTFNRFVAFYNFDRIHSGIDYCSPAEFLNNNGIDIMKNKTNLDSLKCDIVKHKSMIA